MRLGAYLFGLASLAVAGLPLEADDGLSGGLRDWLEAKASVRAESQDWRWLYQEILAVSPGLEEGPGEDAVELMAGIWAQQPGTEIMKYMRFEDEPDHLERYMRAATTLVDDFNGDGHADLGLMIFQGSANCAYPELILSAPGGYRSVTANELWGEQADQGSKCTGSWNGVGITPILRNHEILWLAYAVRKFGGSLRLLSPNTQGGVEVVEEVTFTFELQQFEQAGSEDCSTQLCASVLAWAQPELIEIRQAVADEPTDTPLVARFSQEFDAKGKARENPQHAWGYYSDYTSRLKSFTDGETEYIAKIAPMGLGWREWCCGISIYAPEADSFKVVQHMFVEPYLKLKILKD